MINIIDELEIFMLKEYSNHVKEYYNLEKLRKEFLSKFPVEEIENMLIEDYISPESSKKITFCKWLEFELGNLGKISNRYNNLFGIQYNKDGEYSIFKHWDKSRNIEKGFKKIKKEIKNLIIAGANEDFEFISKSRLTKTFKGKILSTYYPDKYFSVFKESDINIFLINLGVEFDEKLEIDEKKKLLVEYRNNNKELKKFDNYMFMKFLYFTKKNSNKPKILAKGVLLYEEYIEGTKTEVLVNIYERNLYARKKCIEIHGTKCKVCGFDFGEVYGEEFSEKIHIHHRKALSEIGTTYKVDPEKDLVPVCPNCHMIIHSKKDCYSIDEVKELLKNNGC